MPRHESLSAPAAGRRRLLLWIPPVLWMAIIFALSAQSALPSLGVNLSDKLEHAITYAILGVLLLRAIAGGTPAGASLARAALAVGLAASYGLSDEAHQVFVPGRHFDWLDLAADTAGAAAGAGALWAWGIIRRHWTRS